MRPGGKGPRSPKQETDTLSSHPVDSKDGASHLTDPPATADRGVFREFYEGVATRQIDRNTARGIDYRNQSIARRIGRGSRQILEIGPGEGWLVERLLAAGHRVTTTDLSRNWLRRLPSAANPALLRVQANIFHLPFPDATFEHVIAAEVLEHLPGPDAALREIRRILRPGGTFVATVPYRERLVATLCPHCGQTFERNGHLNSFDETRLRDLFRGAGLAPGHLFVGPTRFTREIWRRLPAAALLGSLQALDRWMLATQRVSDTWMLLEGHAGA